jgi:hypothetical protein
MFKSLSAALILLFSGSAHPELVSTGVGIVRGQLVTSRQVQIQNLLEVALYESKPKDKLKLLPLDSKAFAKATQDTLLETVVALEAQNFNLVQVSHDEVTVAEKQVMKMFKDLKAWKGLEVAPKELEAGLRSKIQSKKFIQFRAQSSVLPVTDSEAQRYFNDNRLKFGNLPFENFKENIKSFLSRNQVDRRLKDWFEVLLSKYQVKNLIAEM